MTENNLATSGDESVVVPKHTHRFNQVMGLAIILGALGAIIWLTVAARMGCSDRDLEFVAYVPGVVELRADTRVEFFEQCVGRVTTVEPGVAAVQLNVEGSGALADRESLTVSSGDPEAVVQDAGVTLRYVSSGTIGIEGPGAESRTLTRRPDGFWSVEGTPLVNGGAADDNLVRPGALLTFGPIGIEWSDVGRFTRVSGYIDSSAFEEVSGDVGLVPGLASLGASLGAGTSISVGSRIGINMSGPPQVRLVPSYNANQLVAERSGAREFSPLAGTDVLAFLGEAVDYLSSPGKADAPPVNRYERMIDDMGGSLAELRAAVASARSFADTLGSAANDGGDQLVGRLIVGERQLSVIESALTNIDSVLTTVEATVNSDPDQPPLVGLLFDDQQAESIDRTISNVRSLSEELRDGETPVFTRIAGEYNGMRFDSIVARTDRLSTRANDVLDRIEEGGGGAAKSAKVYGIVTALAQALSTIAVIGIWW